MRLSSAHAVTPLLYRALRAVPIPQRAAEDLHSAFEKNARWNLALSAELCRLSELFERHAIAFVPLKGPVLSQQLYGDLSMRCSSDLDWLVHRRDVLRVRDVLSASRYRVGSPLHWPCDSAYLRSRGAEISMVDESRFLSVDLHWRILPGSFASALTTKTSGNRSNRLRSAAGPSPFYVRNTCCFCFARTEPNMPSHGSAGSATSHPA